MINKSKFEVEEENKFFKKINILSNLVKQLYDDGIIKENIKIPRICMAGMKSGGKRLKKFSLAKWCDEWGLALRGILLATRTLRFWAFFIPVFVIFGILLNMLSELSPRSA